METRVRTTDDASKPELGRRRFSRLRVCIPARLVSIYGTQIVQVTNVGAAGVMVAWSERVRAGSEARLIGGNFELFGHVVWSEDQLGGVAADRPLSDALILSMRAVEPEAVKHDDNPMWALRNFRRTGGRY